MYGNVKIDSNQRSMQSQEAWIDDNNEKITLIDNCEINENNKNNEKLLKNCCEYLGLLNDMSP